MTTTVVGAGAGSGARAEAGGLPSDALRGFAWAVLAYFIAVILWGTIVRATGSGAGCGNHWPLCNGTVIQQSASVQTLIEFGHRITSGLSLVLVLVLAGWTWRATGRGHLARAAALTAVGFTLLEALLGALLVVFGYTAESTAPGRPAFLALHLANTLLMLAALTLTAHLLGRRQGYTAKTVRFKAPFGAVVSVVVFMTVGVTGSLAALGDTLFPASSLAGALSSDFSSASNWLVRWRWTHPTVAFVASIFLIWILVRAAQRSLYGDNRALSAVILMLLALQYALGVMDVALLAPTWLQVVHLLGADILWACLVVLTARVTLLPAE